MQDFFSPERRVLCEMIHHYYSPGFKVVVSDEKMSYTTPKRKEMVYRVHINENIKYWSLSCCSW